MAAPDSRRQEIALAASVCSNLSLLGFFKYFDSPYKSESITDFWRRWHISLSSWLRDYLYLPLGGNRKGEARTYANLAAVMLLGGLWHGAAWNFIIWGGIHGAWLGFERRLGKVSFYRALPRPARIASTFAIVLLSWVFFRSRSVGEALAYLAALVGVGDAGANAEMLGGIIHKPYYVVTVVVAGVITWLAPQTWDWTRGLSLPKVALCLVLLWLSIVLMSSQAYNPFIYFIF